MTIQINFKLAVKLVLLALVGWLLVTNIVVPLHGADELDAGAYLALGLFTVTCLFVGGSLESWLARRMWRHYWLCEGYSAEAADEKVAELRQRTKDSIRSGAFFKEYGPKKE